MSCRAAAGVIKCESGINLSRRLRPAARCRDLRVPRAISHVASTSVGGSSSGLAKRS